MDYYAKLHEKEQVLTNYKSIYPEFEWLEPVLQPLVPSFKTLQETYTDACIPQHYFNQLIGPKNREENQS